MSNYRSPEKTAYMRRSVLSASAGLFLEKGYSNTTIKDISARSGIKVGSVMKVMKSKENILAELVEYVLESQFAITADFLGESMSDPVRFYAAETTLQLYMAESGEGVRDLYATAYSLPKTTAIIQNTITGKLVELFGAAHPDWTREDFYLREIASGGIMRDFMAHPCDERLTMEKKVAAFMETTFLIYRVSDERINEAIRFVSGLDYPALAKNAIDAMLARLARANGEETGI